MFGSKDEKKTRLKVLIIEDNNFFRSIISSALTKHNCKHAANASQGAGSFKTFRPNVTFLDINMPDKSGIEVLQELLSQDPKAFIVMLSGQSDRKTIEQCMDMGAQGFLTKPISKGKLEAYLERYLLQKKNDDEEPSED